MLRKTIEQKTARLRAARLQAQAGSQKPREPDYPEYGMGDELRFGKHAGETVEDVLETDPGWIRWALENVREFGVGDDVLDELRLLDDHRRSVRRDR